MKERSIPLSASRRARAEAIRVKSGAPHVVEYFHQLDDPYLTSPQVLNKFAARYDIVIKPHLITPLAAKTSRDWPNLLFGHIATLG